MVTGATGQIGRFAIPLLLARFHPVLALSRSMKAQAREPVEPLAGNVAWVHPDSWPGTREGGRPTPPRGLWGDVAVLLSCGPVELAVEWAPRLPRLSRVVCISTSSVHTKRNSPDSSERSLIARISQAENQLKAHCAAHGIALVLLRPTLIYGCGLDQNVSRIARLVRRFRLFPVAGKAEGLRQPVHAADLAELAVKLAGTETAVNLESDVGGGSVLTYREMVRRIFLAVGLKPRIVPLPAWLLVLVTRCVAWLPALRGLNAGFVLRQNSDQVFDDSRLREMTGFDPRPFEPSASDLELPASTSFHASTGASETQPS